MKTLKTRWILDLIMNFLRIFGICFGIIQALKPNLYSPHRPAGAGATLGLAALRFRAFIGATRALCITVGVSSGPHCITKTSACLAEIHRPRRGLGRSLTHLVSTGFPGQIDPRLPDFVGIPGCPPYVHECG